MNKGPVTAFMQKYFNAAASTDSAEAYKKQLDKGNKMMITLAGAMSTAEIGKSLAEMIRQDKVHIITCAGANLEEDLLNLVVHNHYIPVPEYRHLSPQEEKHYQIDPDDSRMLAAGKKNIPVIVPGCEDSTTSYGSYSGAVLNEKNTCGKLDTDIPKFIIDSDATIVAPLFFAYVLNWQWFR